MGMKFKIVNASRVFINKNYTLIKTNTAVWFKQMCKKKTHTPDCLNGKTIGNDGTVCKSKEICVATVLSG
jgi:hypothetical protein